MQIAFIGVPIALCADRKGVEQAPDYFRNKGIVRCCITLPVVMTLAMFSRQS